MQSVKVYSFKMALFFDSLIESIKIHIAPKEALNEKTIVRFIHNVLFLFMENCSSPDNHYILYNQVVSAKSLQYLDQKSCFLRDTVDKQIFDCMNSFSVKLERPNNSSNLCNKDSTPQIYCIDNSPNKITDVTPGNSLPCINTGENSVTKINPIKNIDIIPQISIADKMDDNVEDLIDIILRSTPTVNHVKQSTEKSTENSTTDAFIESELNAMFAEEPSENLKEVQNTNYETNLSNQKTEIANSQNSDNSDNMNFLKNINPNKSYLPPILNEKKSNINSSSVFPVEILFDDLVKTIKLTSTPASIPKSTKKDISNKGIKVLNDIVLKPAKKQMPVQPQCNSTEQVITIQNIRQPTTISTENANSVSVIVSPMNTQTTSNKLKQVETENTKVTKRDKLLSEENREKPATDKQLANDYSHVKNNTTMCNSHPTAGVQNEAYIPITEEKTATNRQLTNNYSHVGDNTTMCNSHTTVGIQKQAYIPTRQEKTATNRQVANNYSHVQNNTTMCNSHPTVGIQNQAYIPITQEKTATNRQLTNNYSHVGNNTTMCNSHPIVGIQNQAYIPTRVGMTDYLNTELDNVSANSSPSYMTTNQISQVLPKPNIAPIPTNSLYLQRQYSHPIQGQPTTSIVHPLNRLAHLVYPTNPVPLSRQLSAPSRLHASSTASTTTRPLYLPSLLSKSSVDHPQIKSHTQYSAMSQLPLQPAHLPGYSESVSRSSYSSSLGAAAAVAPLNLHSNIPHEEITHKVTMKQQVVGQTLVHQYSTHTVHTQPNTNAPATYTHEFTKNLQMKQQAEEERQKGLQQQEMLNQQKKQNLLRIKQQLLEKQQNKLRIQQQREMMSYMYYQHNNQQIYNANNNYSVPSGQPNPYTYQTYSSYPTIYDKLMPQMEHNSATVNNLNNQQIRNIATSTTQCYNNNLIYPPITYSHSSAYSARNYVPTPNYLTQQTAKNSNNVPMQINTVSSSPHFMNSLTPAKPNNNVVSNAIQRSSHKTGNQQQMLRVNNLAVLNTSQNETRISPNQYSLEHQLSEMEEFLDITRNNAGTKGTKETNISAVRNSSRDSGYMTPTQQKDPICAYCLGVGSFICSGCVTVYYCSENCQTNAWPSHQDSCYM